MDWKVKFYDWVDASGSLYKNTPHEKKQEIFKYRGSQVHNSKYNYDNTIYGTAKQKVRIVCPEHGEFTQRAQDHLKGAGCPKCSGQSFDWVYFIHLGGDYYKFGVTGRQIQYRIRELEKDYDTVDLIGYMHTEDALTIETELLNKFTKRTPLKGTGHTETRELTTKEAKETKKIFTLRHPTNLV